MLSKSPQPNWNGIQFRVKEERGGCYFMGEVVKTKPLTDGQRVSYPLGSEFKWHSSNGLVVVKSKQPTENKVYIDHIYE